MSNSAFENVTVSPMDEYNQTLVSYVHPPDWVNPKPANSYDLVVIGAGTAGLVVAAGAAGLGLGLKVALIEKHSLGWGLL
jgi:NADPH-dependent 2,4-dienoyl-CoA reductase/sulfur reductase-like enzyme